MKSFLIRKLLFTCALAAFAGNARAILNHSLASGATSVTPTGALDFTAVRTDVIMDAGALTDFSGGTLSGGAYFLASAPGKARRYGLSARISRPSMLLSILSEPALRL